MRHPFENRASIYWLAALVAILAGYLFLNAPSGPIIVAEAEAAVQHAATDHVTPGVGPNPTERPPVPIGGFAIAFAVGVIAIVASLGTLVGAPARPKAVRWVGPRSSIT